MGNHAMDQIVGAAVGIFVVWVLLLILIFFATRWFWLWYFKINRAVALLDRIETRLAGTNQAIHGMLLLQNPNAAVFLPETARAESPWTCDKCGGRVYWNEAQCPRCGETQVWENPASVGGQRPAT
jgi:ribosomal protein S27AE